jgi:hypothetical protein
VKTLKGFGLFLILFFPSAEIFGQKKGKVEVVPKISTEPIAKDCKQLQPGKIVLFEQPDYPPVAKLRACRRNGCRRYKIE